MAQKTERGSNTHGDGLKVELHDPLVLTAGGTDERQLGAPSVLLVSSDNRDHGRVGSQLFDGGCQLQHAYTIEQALPVLSAGVTDVVVSAEHCSDGNWRTLRDEGIKRSQQAPALAFIVLLSHVDVKRMAELLQDGAFDVLAHPMDQAKLLRATAVAHARVVRAREVRQARMSNPGFSTVLTPRGGEESR
jgi:DNA-binding NtrC family response regulator